MPIFFYEGDNTHIAVIVPGTTIGNWGGGPPTTYRRPFNQLNLTGRSQSADFNWRSQSAELDCEESIG